MEPIDNFVHAYKQAPWRVQRQWISISLLIVLGFAMVASLYLMVTSKAAIVGREIQKLRRDIITNQQMNADLQTRLATLTSKAETDRRAYALGYIPIKPGELEYLVVPGYVTPQGAVLATAPELKPSTPSLPHEYTQSLLEWFEERLQSSGGVR